VARQRRATEGGAARATLQSCANERADSKDDFRVGGTVSAVPGAQRQASLFQHQRLHQLGKGRRKKQADTRGTTPARKKGGGPNRHVTATDLLGVESVKPHGGSAVASLKSIGLGDNGEKQAGSDSAIAIPLPSVPAAQAAGPG